jgi:hypothetical protein
VSPAENLAYLLGTYEPYLQEIIRDYVTTGDVVYDIGANIGYVSRYLQKELEPPAVLSPSSPCRETSMLFVRTWNSMGWRTFNS